MSKFAINPNALPDLAAETAAALDRDRAALHHFDDDGAGDAPEQAGNRPGLTPLGPLMVTPDPRYRHGDIDAIEARLAVAKAVREEAIAMTRDTPRKATDHPLIATLVSTLPAPGAAWPVKEREIWLKAAASIFDMAYTAEKASDDEAPEAS